MQYKLSDAVRNTEKSVLIDIHVIPNSKTSQPGRNLGFSQWEPRVRVKVKSPPMKGKANEEVEELFKGLLGSCGIISGRLSPKKTLLVEDCTHREVVEKLGKILEKDI